MPVYFMLEKLSSILGYFIAFRVFHGFWDILGEFHGILGYLIEFGDISLGYYMGFLAISWHFGVFYRLCGCVVAF
jgi:hypothetical protein